MNPCNFLNIVDRILFHPGHKVYFIAGPLGETWGVPLLFIFFCRTLVITLSKLCFNPYEETYTVGTRDTAGRRHWRGMVMHHVPDVWQAYP